MTVKELIEELENYGGHVEVKVVWEEGNKTRIFSDFGVDFINGCVQVEVVSGD